MVALPRNNERQEIAFGSRTRSCHIGQEIAQIYPPIIGLFDKSFRFGKVLLPISLTTRYKCPVTNYYTQMEGISLVLLYAGGLLCTLLFSCMASNARNPEVQVCYD